MPTGIGPMCFLNTKMITDFGTEVICNCAGVGTESISQWLNGSSVDSEFASRFLEVKTKNEVRRSASLQVYVRNFDQT